VGMLPEAPLASNSSAHGDHDGVDAGVEIFERPQTADRPRRGRHARALRGRRPGRIDVSPPSKNLVAVVGRGAVAVIRSWPSSP